jgi:hypothetical protein
MAALTKSEIQAKLDEIQKKRTDLMDKYGLFGGGQEINKLFDHLNQDYKSYEILLEQNEKKEAEELKSIWRHLNRLMKNKALGFVRGLLAKGDVSAMRMGLDVIKDYDEMNEGKEILKSKIESIIGEIK